MILTDKTFINGMIVRDDKRFFLIKNMIGNFEVKRDGIIEFNGKITLSYYDKSITDFIKWVKNYHEK